MVSVIGACGADTDKGSDARADQPNPDVGVAATVAVTNADSDTEDAASKLTTPSTSADDTSPARTTDTETTAVVGADRVRFASPGNEVVVWLPNGFEQAREPRVDSSATGELVSLSFVRDEIPARLIVSLTRGSDASTQLAFDAMDPAAVKAVEGLRDEGTAFIWTDPLTRQRAVAWAPDEATVAWVYGDGLGDDELISIVRTIEVSRP
jgi:hypothetical protein